MALTHDPDDTIRIAQRGDERTVYVELPLGSGAVVVGVWANRTLRTVEVFAGHNDPMPQLLAPEWVHTLPRVEDMCSDAWDWIDEE